MISEVLETKNGRVLLLPNDILPIGPVDIIMTDSHSVLVRSSCAVPTALIQGYFDGPYRENGLIEPEDPAPEPAPSF